MIADRRSPGDGLLYIPDDELVRSTVEGDGADWSDARSYVPSDILVATVLRTSVRELPRFKFPESCLRPESRDTDSPLRIASALFAAIQLSPSALAAAVILHVGALVAVGPLRIGGSQPIGAATRVQFATPSPRLVYVVPRPAGSPSPNRGRAVLGVAWRGAQAQKPDSVSATIPRDSLVDVGRIAATGVETGPAERELAAALAREFLLGGDPLRVEAPQREELAGLARILAVRPLVYLRVVGTGPTVNSAFGARPGMREAEAFARELIALGVLPDRIDLEADTIRDRCPPREPRCAANRSRVQTSLVLRR